VTPQLRAFPSDSSLQALVLPVAQIVHATRVDDPSLPDGAALWICCVGDVQVVEQLEVWVRKEQRSAARVMCR
jgi:hypothetical protein